MGSWFPHQASNLLPWHWTHLTTGLPGKSHFSSFFDIIFLSVILKSLICIYILYAAPFSSCCKYCILVCPCLITSVIVIIIITSFLQLLLITTWLKYIECLPWSKAWQPTPVFLSGESHGQRKLAGYSPRGRKELDTAEQLMHTHPLCQVYLSTVGYYLIYFSQRP